MKLFISYRSTDSKKVDPLIARLRSLKYQVWQDKDSIPVGQDWWEAICEGIIKCDVFIFMVSAESVKSFACLAELSFAHKLNLPIIPFVLEGEWVYNAGGKYTIDFWDDIPPELQDDDNRAQFLFYEGVTFVDKLRDGIDKILEKNLPRFPADPPPDPRHASDASNNVTTIYDEAYDFAYRGEFATAEKLFRKLVTRNDPIFGGIAHQWVTIIREYERIKAMAERKSTRKIAQGHWIIYTKQFPLDFIDGIFDPHDIDHLLQQTPSVNTPLPAQRSGGAHGDSVLGQGVRAKPTSLSMMPAPFAWVEIPDKGYSIAKYPVTNAQFAKFIEAGGYKQQEWWTAEGWRKCQEGWHFDEGWKASGTAWTRPRYWTDSKWNGAEQPVVGVSWFEAVAFCRWLSDTSGESIMLPTEEQWQYAAQGDDGRDYPWGNNWNCESCNNSVKPCGSNVTTPVRQYEGKGDSPFGVVDMAGNVWEWCLTDYVNKTNDMNSVASDRLLRGGSWIIVNAGWFHCGYRYGYDPPARDLSSGFRIARS